MVERTHRARQRLQRGLRWLLPAAIIAAILTTIDLATFAGALARTNAWVAVAGILLVPSRNLIAALRWRIAVHAGFPERLDLGWTLRHYWTGVALGFFTPSSLGLDAYRIAAVTRRLGRLAPNVALVLLEKGLALLGCTLMVLVVTPLLPPVAVGPEGQVRRMWLAAWILLLVAAAGLLALGLLLRTRLANSVGDWTERLFARALARVSRTADVAGGGPPTGGHWTALLRPALHPRPLAGLLAASVGIQLAAAFGNAVMFHAIGYELPFVTHLFVVPVLYIVFALPISLGSLGLREGAFIVVYGLFGVPAEIALLASVLNLGGILLNNVIGAGVILAGGRHGTREVSGA